MGNRPGSNQLGRMLKLGVSADALLDLQEAVLYYNRQQAGLGKKFEKIIKECFLRIQQMPQAASFVYDTVRYKVVDKFPFIITYEETGNEVIILRVFNELQNPEKLK